jgi:hypothetical protein
MEKYPINRFASMPHCGICPSLINKFLLNRPYVCRGSWGVKRNIFLVVNTGFHYLRTLELGRREAQVRVNVKEKDNLKK